MLAVLLVDLGDVVATDSDRSEVIEAIAKIGGAMPEKIIELKAACEEEKQQERIDTGKMSDTELFEKFIKITGISRQVMPESRFWPLFVASHLHPVPEIVIFLRRLQNIGHKIIAFSNGDSGSQYLVDVLQLWNLCPAIGQPAITFDGQVISRDIGVKKPNRLIYQAGVDLAKKISGQENPLIILIDNIPEYVNPKVLASFGIKGICWDVNYNSVAELESELRMLGIDL
jgi:FMN phosphatase YigB (HAD superfamily)